MWAVAQYSLVETDHACTHCLGLDGIRLRKREDYCLVAQCSLVETDHDHRGALYLHLLPLWRQKGSLKHWYCSTRLHGITSQKTVIFRRTSGLTRGLSPTEEF